MEGRRGAEGTCSELGFVTETVRVMGEAEGRKSDHLLSELLIPGGDMARNQGSSLAGGLCWKPHLGGGL